jgi:serine phosphatase RsbU (regulator of sigma subunit)
MTERLRDRSSPMGRAFDAYLDGLIHRWTGTVAALGFTLYPIFGVLDYFTMPPELLGRFLTYRGIVTVAVLLQYFVVRNTRPSRLSVLHGYVFNAITAGFITWMTVDLGGFNSSYYAGLNLVVIAVNLLLPWRPIHSAVNGILVLAMYVAANALFGGPFEVTKLVNNLFFLGGTVVIAIAVARAKHQLIANEFVTRAELLNANLDLDRSRQELKAARDALWGEMEVAKRIQTSLLPENRRVGGYDVAARMQPAAEVGGDYYDIIQADEERNWIAIGDVSGHGVESGLVMMMTQTSILSLVHENPRLSPAEVFSAVNDVLLENISRLRATRYMTLNVVRLGPDGLTLAGKHQDVLVWRRATRRVETVSNEGCWIGVVDDTRGHVEDQAIAMDDGDVALFFTDGATEAMNASGEMFGEERLAAALEAVAERPLPEALEALFARIAEFRSVQDDDVTLMLVRHAPDAATARRGVAPPAAASNAA